MSLDSRASGRSSRSKSAGRGRGRKGRVVVPRNPVPLPHGKRAQLLFIGMKDLKKKYVDKGWSWTLYDAKKHRGGWNYDYQKPVWNFEETALEMWMKIDPVK